MLPAPPSRATSPRPVWAQTERWYGGRRCVGESGSHLGILQDKSLCRTEETGEAAVGTRGVFLRVSRAGKWGGRTSFRGPLRAGIAFGRIRVRGWPSPPPRTNGEGRCLLPATCPWYLLGLAAACCLLFLWTKDLHHSSNSQGSRGCLERWGEDSYG